MKKYLSCILYIIMPLLTAALTSYYWFSNGQSIPIITYIAVTTFIAALPIPWLLSSYLPFIKGRRLADQADIDIPSQKQFLAASTIDTLVLSRHGVITEGRPYVASLCPAGVSQNTLLALAASAEKQAVHPVGQAIYETAHQRNINLLDATTFNEIPGCGVEAIVGRNSLRVGSLLWLKHEKISVPADLITKNDQLAQRGHITVFVANGQYCRGIIAIDDGIADDTTRTLRKLKRRHLRLIMLTSENKRTAEALGRKAGLDDVHSQLSPEGKVRELQLLKARGTGVAIVERGFIPPELQTVADTAIELAPAADEHAPAETPPEPQTPGAIFIKSGQLWDLNTLIDISQNTLKRVSQNKTIAVAAWLITIPAAAGLLFPLGVPFLPPWGALCGQLLTLLLIIINSLR
ncbi:HAD family hydrolase [Selenomonas sp. AE3005]|uniref:HAD family hydrolase n=1 Tax=Selenomonas sp. AE3005 TaxID=1485543 RepID=UPI0025E58F44|nr:HAD family hydrolase [Selenomonas sp. AE3005]